MLKFETLQFIISKIIYIAGERNVNLHIYRVNEETERYNFVDIRFQDAISYIDNVSGFSPTDVSEIYQSVLLRKEDIFSYAKKLGELSVESEEELYFEENS